MKRMILWMLMGCALMLFAAGCGGDATQAPAGSAQTLDGAALATEKCSDCHTFERATNQKRSLSGWHEVVRSMENRGLKITQPEFDAITEFLAKNYGK